MDRPVSQKLTHSAISLISLWSMIILSAQFVKMATNGTSRLTIAQTNVALDAVDVIIPETVLDAREPRSSLQMANTVSMILLDA